MSDLSIATVGSVAKSAYPLFPPAGTVEASVSALDAYFRALDQTPVPSPSGSSSSGKRSAQQPGSALSQAGGTPASLPVPPSNFGPSGSSGPASPYAPVGSGRATSTGGSGRSAGLVDTYG